MQIIRGIQDIDFENLKRGQHFLTVDYLTENNENEEYEEEIGAVNNMFFDENDCGIYRFRVFDFCPELYFDKEDGEMFVQYNKVEETLKHYIMVNNQVVNLGCEDNRSIRDGQLGYPLDEMATDLFTKPVGDTFYLRMVTNYDIEDIFMVKISDENVLVQVLRNEIKASQAYWRYNISTYIANINGKTKALNGVSENIIDKIAKILPSEHIEYFKLLKKTCQTRCGKINNDYLDIIKQYFTGGNVTVEDIESFFTPFFVDEDTNLEIYISDSGYFGGRHCYAPYINGKYDTEGFSKVLATKKENDRIFKAIFEYISNGYRGISPHDGEYHTDRDTIEENRYKVLYEDAEAVKYEYSRNEYGYYVLENGYYFKATGSEIQQIEDRIRMMDMLLTAEKINLVG